MHLCPECNRGTTNALDDGDDDNKKWHFNLYHYTWHGQPSWRHKKNIYAYTMSPIASELIPFHPWAGKVRDQIKLAYNNPAVPVTGHAANQNSHKTDKQFPMEGSQNNKGLSFFTFPKKHFEELLYMTKYVHYLRFYNCSSIMLSWFGDICRWRSDAL